MLVSRLSVSAHDFSELGAQAILHAIRDYNCTLTECRLTKDMLGDVTPGLIMSGDRMIRSETENEIVTLCHQNKASRRRRREHVEANKSKRDDR